MEIFAPVMALGVLGLLFGALLGVAAKKLKVDVDERIEQISECLPGANCGGCGYAGCSALADAIVKGKVAPTVCGGCTNENIQKIAKILGTEISEKERLVARVMCAGNEEICGQRFLYEGIRDCHVALRYSNGSKACQYGCLGYGSCVMACKFGALSIKDRLAVVDTSLCVGCGACIKACPRGIIKLTPEIIPAAVLCSSNEKGARMKKICDVGCIGCKLCEKECDDDAIHVIDNLAVIDRNKCTKCGKCAAKCPKKSIHIF